MRFVNRPAVAAATMTFVGVAVAAAPTAGAMVENWQVTNKTSVPLQGEMHGQCGSANANWATDAAHPFKQEDVVHSRQDCGAFDLFYVWGRMCYHGYWWNLPRAAWHSDNYAFAEKSLATNPTLYVQLDDGKTADLVETSSC